MKIGESALITDPIAMRLDMSEVCYYWAIKFGNPARYEKTTNKQTTFTGKAWNEACREAVQVDGVKFKGDYRSADVPFVVLKDFMDIKKALVAKAPAGARIGKSLSTTEWKEFQTLLQAVTKAGLNVDTAVIDLLVHFKERTNNNGNKWGVLTFELIGEAAPADAEQAA
jgi:hypothetical protein